MEAKAAAEMKARTLSVSCDSLKAGQLQAQLEADKAAQRAEAAEETVDKLQSILQHDPTKSAVVVSSEPLVLGIEAQDDDSAIGDATEEFAEALEDVGAHQAFRIGRASLAAAGIVEEGLEDPEGSVPASATVTLKNNGTETWPETVVISVASGDALGMPLLKVPALTPDESTEITMDLKMPRALEAGSASSTWAVRDAATGKPLGPLLVFELRWVIQ